MIEQAHARHQDPQTSHDAADAVTPDLRELQARVATYARAAGPGGFTDAQMSDDMEDYGSTLRTRRSELTDRNIILNSGRTALWGDSARRRIVWVHRDFVDDAPDVREPPKPISAEDKAEAIKMADQLRQSSIGIRKEGRAMLADLMEDCSKTIRKFAQ